MTRRAAPSTWRSSSSRPRHQPRAHARRCPGPHLRGAVQATLGIAALALAERARHLVAEHAALIRWLDAPSGDFPVAFVATSADEEAATARVQAAVQETGLDVPALSASPTRAAALLAVVHACGVRRPEQIEATLVMAQMPCVIAEAFAASPVGFQDYPMRLPPYRHEVSR